MNYLEKMPDPIAKRIPEEWPEEAKALAFALTQEAASGEIHINLQKALTKHTDIKPVENDERYCGLLTNFGKYYWPIYQAIRKGFEEVHGDVIRVARGEGSPRVTELANWDPFTKTLYMNLTSDEPIAQLNTISIEATTDYLAVVDVVVTSVQELTECNGGIYYCPKCGEEIKRAFDPLRAHKSTVITCPKCGNNMVLKTPFAMTRVELTVQEPIEKGGNDPSQRKVVLRHPVYLTVNINPGDRLRLTVIPKAEFKNPRPGEVGELVLEAIGVEKQERFKQEYRETTIHSVSDSIEMVSKCIAPGIVGKQFDLIKRLIAIQMYSMIDDVGRDRDRIHILLVGDPGTGKSRILQSAADLAGLYVSAEHVTGAGLTVSAERSQSGWRLKAGAAILADQNLLALDEIDKASEQDINYLLELMESGKASVAKAGITTEVKSAVTVLAAANPKESTLAEALARVATELGYQSYQEALEEYDRRTLLIAATNISAPMASRFDIIIPIETPQNDPKFYAKIATSQYEKPDEELLNKARAHIQYATTEYAEVKIPEKLEDEIHDQIKKLMNTTDFTPRLAKTLTRLAKAHARAHLRDEVIAKDVRYAAHIMETVLTTEDGDPSLNLHKIEVAIEREKRKKQRKTSSRASKRKLVKEIVEDLYSGEPVPLNEITEKAKEHNIPRDELQELLDDLVTDGELLQPEPGKYAPL